ncbi:hypothetical protein [Streptomyces sp. NPDC091416]|uniref:hypothetical protein n=1 Tax=Streptomyces sp. NPDC091416 TaxID=3366003 RepID=UPI0038019281
MKTLPAALFVEGINDHTPVKPLRTALARVATWPTESGRTHADLTLYPVHQDRASASRWYEVWWTHRTVVAAHESPWDETEAHPEVSTVRIEQAAVLPAPPVVPLDQRLAAIPPVDITRFTEAELRLLGGEDKARTFLERRQKVAVANDSTVDTYDWAAYVVSVIEHLDVPARSLTAGQRAAAALARYLDAQRAERAARASVLGMTANAIQANDLIPLDHLRQTAPLLDPTLVTEPTVAEAIAHTAQTPQTAGRRGRPSIGPAINVSYPADLLSRIDAMACQAGLQRAPWLRQAAAAEVARAERRAAGLPD